LFHSPRDQRAERKKTNLLIHRRKGAQEGVFTLCVWEEVVTLKDGNINVKAKGMIGEFINKVVTKDLVVKVVECDLIAKGPKGRAYASEKERKEEKLFP